MFHEPAATCRSRLPRGWVGLFVALGCGLPAVAAGPAIERIMPPGGPCGAEVEVEFRGRDLDEAREVLFEEAAITVTALQQVDPRTVKATLRIPPDCPLGGHRLRIRTADGLSELRTFRIAGFPQVRETEPNNERAAAQAVTAPVTVVGVVTAEDVDCYKVHLPAGGRISAAIEAIRLDQEMFDPHLELIDDKGFTVAACDDHPLLAQDGMLAAVAPAEGDYVVRVRESAFGGNDGCVYMLHIGDFPVPHVAWPPAGRPGASLDVEWLGDPAGPFRQTVNLPANVPPAGVAEIVPVRDGRPGAVPVPIRVVALPRIDEAEPDDEPAKATPATAPVGLLGRMNAAEDVDWFRIAAPKGSQWTVRAWARQLGSPIDVVVNAHRDDEKRERLTGNDDTEGPDSFLRVTAPEQGSFLLRVNDHLRRAGPEYSYWLEVEPAWPEVLASVPPARGNSQERLVAEVPRGGRAALVFNTSRTDFGGPARLAFAGLPAGVVAEAPPAAPNAPGTLAVFEATADAVPGTACAEVLVMAAADGRPLGTLRQRTELVLGQPNNAPYRTSTSDRLPVAVVEEAPIRIDVEQPAVPLVRRGVLDLKVRIERLDGFTGRVRLAVPFRPPGVNAAVNVEIPEDQTEATYQLSATPDAALADWQVVVTAAGLVKADPKQPKQKEKGGRRRREGETIWVSSRLVPLKVAEPLLEMAAEKVTVEQGQETRVVWAVKKPASFSGVAKAKLLGLPAKTEAPELDLAADVVELAFPVKVAGDAPSGQHANVFCQVRIPQGDAWIVHNMPPTQLRIDKPLPAKEATP
jgi:hypothetical protein